MPLNRPIRLPVLDAAAIRPRPWWRRAAIWRAASLIVVNLAIISHVLYWHFTGSSMERTVFSDSMRTLELGEVTPGFMLFLLAIASTALFGRFFCGWLCHMGALQDLCAWLLRRVGIRPRLFRSRVLGFIPLALGVYMFVLPTLYREVVNPLVRHVAPGALAPAEPFPGVSLCLTTRNLWEGLPSVWVAVPFLALCGFGMVYFLGARGLCRYGCPYGALLLPMERLAPARVRVDPARCDQCGLCTKACTGGVRVHDQIREFGAVLDQNCIKTLDCVNSCPSHAISLSFGRPAQGRRPAAHGYDLSWKEEAACGGVALVVFFVARGLYGLIPMLMAASIAVVSAFLSWKAICYWRDPNVRLGAFVLRRQGHSTPAGALFCAAFSLLVAMVAHSATIRVLLHSAERVDDRVVVSFQQALAGDVPADQRRLASEALGWYRLTQPLGRGGVALAPSPGVEIRSAWLLMVAGRMGEAETLLRDELERRPSDRLLVTLGRVLAGRGRVADSIETLRASVGAHPSWIESRQLLSTQLLSVGRFDEAQRLYRDVLETRPQDPDALCGLGRVLMLGRKPGEGLDLLRRAVSIDPRSPARTLELAFALNSLGRVDEALATLADLSVARPSARSWMIAVGSDMLQAAGRQNDIPRWQDRSLRVWKVH